MSNIKGLYRVCYLKWNEMNDPKHYEFVRADSKEEAERQIEKMPGVMRVLYSTHEGDFEWGSI